MVNLATALALKPNERIYKILRRHAITLAPRLVLAGLCIVLPFFFLFFADQWKSVGVIIFAFMEGIGILLAIRAFFMWDSTVLVITSHRLCQVRQQGVWKRSVVETPLHFVQEVGWRRNGIWETVLAIGTMTIRTSPQAEAEDVFVSCVPRPDKVQSLINEVREKRAWQLPIGSEQAAPPIARIAELLDQADAETVAAVEALLQSRINQPPTA